MQQSLKEWIMRKLKTVPVSARALRQPALQTCGMLIFWWMLAIQGIDVWAQDTTRPFWREIEAFRKQDSIAFPPGGQILFIGSSSFTLWKDVQQYFPGKPILNRAFGGSTLADVYHYRHEVIAPYRPRQVVIYCGENDFAGSDTTSVSTVAERFRQLFRYIRKEYPRVPVAYVSMKPSPSRARFLEKYIAANNAIRKYLSQQSRTRFVDVYDAMLGPDGRPLSHLFQKDSLHMNAEGYKIWQQKLNPVLLK